MSDELLQPLRGAVESFTFCRFPVVQRAGCVVSVKFQRSLGLGFSICCYLRPSTDFAVCGPLLSGKKKEILIDAFISCMYQKEKIDNYSACHNPTCHIKTEDGGCSGVCVCMCVYQCMCATFLMAL